MRQLETFQLILLRRPAEAPEYDEATLESIQQQHLAHYDALRSDGRLVTFGPVLEQPDVSLRGIAVFAVGSVDEARALAETDPAVAAGRLAVEAMTYLTAPGSLTPPGIPIALG
jgi:uncharacterized protein YciI